MKHLVHRLSRVNGQINALKNQLDSDTPPSCSEVIRQVKAADQALKKFAQAYAQQNLEQCVNQKKSLTSIQAELEEVLNSAFTL